jgi:RES domain-containing protein
MTRTRGSCHLQTVPSTERTGVGGTQSGPPRSRRGPQPLTDCRDLLRRLGRVQLSCVDTAVWLHLSLREVAGSGEGARGTGGRFNPPNSFPVVYGALGRETAGAELRRLAHRNAISIASFLPRHIYWLRLRSSKVIDLRCPEVASTLGLPGTGFPETSQEDTRLIGELANALEFEAIIAPSVTGFGSMIAIFSDRVDRSTLDIRHKELWANLDDVPGVNEQSDHMFVVGG